MKAFLCILSLTVFGCAQLIAQPTINAVDILPSPGESFTMRKFSPKNLTTGKIGANVTWDYSFLSTTDGNTKINVLAPSATPNGNKYPNANLCIKEDTTLAYYNGSSSEFLFYGADVSGNLGIYTDPDEHIIFPVTYGDTNVDAFKGTIAVKVPGLGTFNSSRSGKTVMKATGYGTLMIPGMTFTDVLKLEITSEQADHIKILILDTTIITKVKIYQWVKAGMHNPVLTIIKTVSDIQPDTIYTANYWNFEVGIEESLSQSNNLKMLNNFCEQRVYLNYSLNQPENVNVEVYNTLGARLNVLQDGIQSHGIHKLEMDVSNFSAGIYLVHVNIGERRECLKLIVP